MSASLLEFLQLPDHRHVVFERPPLVQVICQIRFPELLQLPGTGSVLPFYEAIQVNYPVVTRPEEMEIQIGFDPGGPSIKKQQSARVWQFTDVEDNWKVVLNPTFLAIETRAYSHFEDFLDRLRVV